VKVEEWPKSIMPEGTFDDVAKVVNRVTLGEITIGEPILSARLAPEGSSAGLSAMIPPGQRAMTVKVDEVIGVAGFITPGTYVDIVTTVTQPGMEAESVSRIILQGVKVLASGKRIEHRQDGEATEVNTVTLQVTPDQAEVLALASNAGKLQLVMRNTVDQDQIQTAGVNTPALFGGLTGRSSSRVGAPQAEPRPGVKPSKPAASPAAPPQAIVEVIRGAERATVTFSK
jgi:pilus assembly protein CpaB